MYVALLDKADGDMSEWRWILEYEISANGAAVRLKGTDFEALVSLRPGERMTITEDPNA